MTNLSSGPLVVFGVVLEAVEGGGGGSDVAEVWGGGGIARVSDGSGSVVFSGGSVVGDGLVVGWLLV